MPHRPLHVPLAEALERLPSPDGERMREVLRHGSLRIEIYAPFQTDIQEPHDQDEIYVIHSGRGRFVRGDAEVLFEPGDVLFVPAGVAHHFADFTDDFVTWVILYGPEGGEPE